MICRLELPTALLCCALAACSRADTVQDANEEDWGHAAPAQAKPAADEMEKAREFIAFADSARDSGKYEEAVLFYREANRRYNIIAESCPADHAGIVRFHVTYCTDQIAAISALKDAGEPDRADANDAVADDVPAAPAPSPNATTSPGAFPDNRAAPLTESGQTLEAIVSRARSLLAGIESEEARSVLMLGLKMAPDNREVRLLIAAAQCQAGAFDDALYLVDELIAEKDDDSAARMLRATVNFGLGRIREADGDLDRAIEMDPSNAEAHYDRAQFLIATRTGDPARIRSHYMKALSLGAEPDEELEARLKDMSRSVNPPETANK